MGKGHNRIPPLQTSEGLRGVSLEQLWEGGPHSWQAERFSMILRPVLFLSLHCWGENPSRGPQDLGYV